MEIEDEKQYGLDELLGSELIKDIEQNVIKAKPVVSEEITEEIVESKSIENVIDIVANKVLINGDEDETNLTLAYAKRVLTLELQMKELKDDLKVIRKDAKDDGVSTVKVNKVLTQMKTYLKTNEMDLLEIEQIEVVLEQDLDVKTMILEIIKKD